jgi:hypothetical protein
MSTEIKTMFGWGMDKNLDNFNSEIGAYKTSEAIEYLIERCKIAEAKVKELEYDNNNMKEIIRMCS